MHPSHHPAVFLAAAIAAPLVAATNTVTDVTSNAPIVVVASRAGRTVEEIPATVKVISAEDIRESGAPNVVSALENLAGVYFRHNSDNPNLADIAMRGFSQNSHGRVLVLVDGQRLNTADMATLDWLRIPSDAIERIEVLHGGQTALYGDNAVGGVINIITRQPGGQPVTTLGATVGSDRTLAAHVGHAGSIGDSVHYTADADWRTSDGWRDNSDYRNADLRASLAKTWSEQLESDLSAFYTDDRYGMPGFLSVAELRANPRKSDYPLDEAHNRTMGGSLGWRGEIAPDNRLEGAFAFTHRAAQSDWYSGSSFASSLLDSATFSPRYTCDADLAGHRNSLLIGMDLGFSRLHIRSFTNFAHTVQTTAATLNRANAGAYAQDQFWLTDKLALTLGGRAEVYRYTADVQDVFAGTSTGSVRAYRQSALEAALQYHPTERLRLFGHASTLYHDPFLDELTGAYGYIPPAGVPVPPSGMNLDLKPEIGQQYEIGSEYRLDKQWRASLTLYRLDMEDEIAYGLMDPTTFKYGNMNLSRTRRYGADLALAWQRAGVGLVSLDYNYVDAFFADGSSGQPEIAHKQIPLVPAQVVTLHGELELPLDLAALATAHGVSAQYLGDDNTHESPRLPAYGTLDLGLRYRPHQFQGFEIVASVDNVLDNRYAGSGYDWGAPFGAYDVYYPAPGRTWTVAANYRF